MTRRGRGKEMAGKRGEGEQRGRGEEEGVKGKERRGREEREEGEREKCFCHRSPAEVPVTTVG